MGDSVWTFVFEIANFIALAAALGWLFFKPVRAAIENQQAAARQVREVAAQKLAEADRLRQQVDAQRANLATELDAMRTQAAEQTKREAQQQIADTLAEIARERDRYKREVVNIDQSQTAKLALAVAGAAQQAMTQLLQQIKGPELEQALLRAACRELRALGADSLAPVTIESATELDGGSKELLQDALGSAAASTHFRIVPELLGGVRVSTSRGLVDASIAGLANFTEHALSSQLQSIVLEEPANA